MLPYDYNAVVSKMSIWFVRTKPMSTYDELSLFVVAVGVNNSAPGSWDLLCLLPKYLSGIDHAAQG